MKVSLNGIKFIQRHEGTKYHVYLDPVNKPTGGIGHLLTTAERKLFPVGTKLSQAQVDKWFVEDLTRFTKAINKLITVPINQNQFDAMLSLAFNIGEGNFRKSSVLRYTNAKNFQKAADSFKLFNKATRNGKKIVLPGLTRRRTEEAKLYLTPVRIAKSDQPITNDILPVQPTAQNAESITPPTPTANTPLPVEQAETPQATATTSVSKSSLFAAAGAGLLGVLTWIGSWIQSNPAIIVVAAILIIGALWYYNNAKQRSNDRNVNK